MLAARHLPHSRGVVVALAVVVPVGDGHSLDVPALVTVVLVSSSILTRLLFRGGVRAVETTWMAAQKDGQEQMI